VQPTRPRTAQSTAHHYVAQLHIERDRARQQQSTTSPAPAATASILQRSPLSGEPLGSLPRSKMKLRTLKIVTSIALASPVAAMLVTDGSPCDQYCGNVLSSTTGTDMTCDEAAFRTASLAPVFQTCVTCELRSNYSAHGQSDLQWLICNSHLSTCLWPRMLTWCAKTTSATLCHGACSGSPTTRTLAARHASQGRWRLLSWLLR
jgi:hypothetical protein